jgi:hypothetical protein
MAKSHKPVVWFPFAAGGTVIAFCMPVIVVLRLPCRAGPRAAGLSYETLHAFAAHGLGKLVLLRRGRAIAVEFGPPAALYLLRFRPARRYPGRHVLYVAAIIGSAATAAISICGSSRSQTTSYKKSWHHPHRPRAKPSAKHALAMSGATT